jgi:DNA mismatch repair protein MutL
VKIKGVIPINKIHVLDKQIAELIAAGEVVERPASVIKELVENAIDSGASSITVEISHGGITFMRVTDNGCGIAREDVPTAFLRHATSKVRDEDDLERIGTLGFRGEALASICAVSRVTLITRTQEELAGTSYVIEGGEEQSLDDTGCAVGTTLIVQDLFYNTPARMKFLKKDISEANAVAGVVDRSALSHPEISFRFIRDGKEELHTPGDKKLQSCIYAVFGKEYTAGLIPVDYSLRGIGVKGFVTKPSNARPNRSMQYFFINGRYVKSRTAMVALEEAMKGSIMVGKFPGCVLHLGIPCESVDVNVHPAKIEVRFINERPIFDAVYHAVKSSLLDGDKMAELKLHSLPPADQGKVMQVRMPNPTGGEIPPKPKDYFSFNQAAEIQEAVAPEVLIPPKTIFDAAILHDWNTSKDNVIQYRNALEALPEEQTKERHVDAQEFLATPSDQSPVVLNDSPREPFIDQKQQEHIIGEAFQTYILLEHGPNELILIDKHAAHERLLYERLKEESGKSSTQLLLDPIPVTLNKEDYGILMENQGVLQDAGFYIEEFGAGSVLIREAPLFLDSADLASMIIEIAGYLASHKRDVRPQHLDWLYHNIACRAAVKSGQTASMEEMTDLVRKLQENPELRYCPHGRPVYIVIKKREIEKQFGRL